MSRAAEQEVERFRRGERFDGRITDFVTDGKADEHALEVLWKALGAEAEPVREEIVHLLEAIGVQVDPAGWTGGGMLRDKRILAILLDAGISKGVGLGRQAALEVIQAHVPPDVIREHADLLVQNLKQWPGPTILLIAAKGKLEGARSIVHELSATPRWAADEAALVAAAALGDTAAERHFVDPFLAATDPEEKVRLGRLLGFIGTRSALAALGSELRTSLEIVVQRSFRRSVRVDLIAALHYDFPEVPILFENAVKDDAGYEAVEHFVEQHFGVTWKKPRPPFLTIEGFPIPIMRP